MIQRILLFDSNNVTAVYVEMKAVAGLKFRRVAAPMDRVPMVALHLPCRSIVNPFQRFPSKIDEKHSDKQLKTKKKT